MYLRLPRKYGILATVLILYWEDDQVIIKVPIMKIQIYNISTLANIYILRTHFQSNTDVCWPV